MALGDDLDLEVDSISTARLIMAQYKRYAF